MDLSESLIFADGHLGRKHKEMVATFVSEQNSCPYCVDSHAYFLRVHGGSAEALNAIRTSHLDSPFLTASEQALLLFVRKVNQSSHQIEPTDVDLLRQAGWSDSQIAEAIHVAALFATFNRVANAFGLRSQGHVQNGVEVPSDPPYPPRIPAAPERCRTHLLFPALWPRSREEFEQNHAERVDVCGCTHYAARNLLRTGVFRRQSP